MKTKLLVMLAALLFAGSAVTAAETNTFDAAYQALVDEIRAELAAGKNTASDLADELQRFESLVAKHRDEKTTEVARAAATLAMLHLQVGNTEKAIEQAKRLKTDFPDTAPAKDADRMIAFMEKRAKSAEIQAKLQVGAEFPDFSVQDLNGKQLALSDFKGRVTLIDFWATWCGPCLAELPHVIGTYEKHHSKGFEIIGISLDEESDRAKLKSFVEQRKMTWPQYFDGKGWNNELASKFGIESIPATFLLDRTGKIIGRDLRGDELEKAVVTALKAK